MRVLIFFDLPRGSAKEVSAAARFVKDLKKEGFLMLQESVYCKLILNLTALDRIKIFLNKVKPRVGSVIMLVVTEKQFENMELLVGENNHAEIDRTNRVIII